MGCNKYKDLSVFFCKLLLTGDCFVNFYCIHSLSRSSSSALLPPVMIMCQECGEAQLEIEAADKGLFINDVIA